MRHKFNSARLFSGLLSLLVLLQGAVAQPPGFEQYPVKNRFHGKPSPPLFRTPEEREYQAVITDGVEKGWGIFDGVTGSELRRPGPNFAGHYILISFGCGDSYSNCLGVAIVDAKTGQIFGPPIPESGTEWRPYFAMAVTSLMPHPPASFHNFPFKSPIAYRLTSRLLIVRICEGLHLEEAGGIIRGVEDGCGDHYYVMDEDGLKLIYRSGQ